MEAGVLKGKSGAGKTKRVPASFSADLHTTLRPKTLRTSTSPAPGSPSSGPRLSCLHWLLSELERVLGISVQIPAPVTC